MSLVRLLPACVREQAAMAVCIICSGEARQCSWYTKWLVLARRGRSGPLKRLRC